MDNYTFMYFGPSLARNSCSIPTSEITCTNFNLYSISFSCKAAKVTDKRVRIMNEIITGIRLIKMNAWEYAFKTLVNNFRRLVIYLCLQI